MFFFFFHLVIRFGEYPEASVFSDWPLVRSLGLPHHT
jgi:hypothetical protein